MIFRPKKTRLTQILVIVFVIALLVVADPRPIYFSIGVVIVLLGLSIRLWTYGYLHKNRELAMDGPYAYTRNPAYFGSFVVMIGLFVAAGNPTSGRGIACWIVGVVGVVVFLGWYMPMKYEREYPGLRASFPDQFARHEATTPNFFPRMPQRRTGTGRTFSWRRLKNSRELKRPLIVAVALVLMWLL